MAYLITQIGQAKYNIAPVGEVSYSEELTLFLDGLLAELTNNHKTLLNDLVIALKDGLSISNLSDAFDVIYVGKTATEETQLRNLVKREFDGTHYNSLYFNPFEGVTGNGVNSYIGTGFVPSEDANAYQLNGGSVHVFCKTLPQENTYIIQAGQTETGGVLNLTPNRTDNSFISRHNTTSFASKEVEMDNLSPGMISLNRDSPSNYILYNNKSKIGDFNTDAVGLPDIELELLRNGSYYATNELEFIAVGRSFTEAEIDIITDAYNNYSEGIDAILAAETLDQGELQTQTITLPDMFNTDLEYPQAGYETALTWLFDAIKAKGMDSFIVAGDLTNGRWGDKTLHDITTQTNIYWAAFKARLDAQNIDYYLAMGDHEYGDLGQDMSSAYSSIADVPEWRSQFRSIFQMPEGAPSPYDQISYTIVKDNSVFIVLCGFEDLGGSVLSSSVSGVQLAWLEEELIKHSDKKFKFVHIHQPTIVPDSGTGSRIRITDGINTEFWQMLVKYGVDFYDCGEWHNTRDKKENGGIIQITHGSHFGHDYTHTFLHYNVYENKIFVEAFSYDIQMDGAEIREDIYEGLTIVDQANDPTSVGTITIWNTSIGKYKELRTGIFEL